MLENKLNLPTKIMVLVTMAFLLPSCGTLSPPESAATQPVAKLGVLAAINHTIAPGDRLGDISLKYTGTVKNWRAIADYNNVEDPKSLKIGDVITIPPELIQPVFSGSSESSVIQEQRQNTQVANTATSTSLGVQSTSRSIEATSDVIVQPVNPNRTFELNPIDTSTWSNSTTPNTFAPQVRVVGSYFPKAVYQQPVSYSNLIMRVTPGTVLELERTVNDWFKVITPEGVGYLRISDGTLVDQ